MKLIQKNHKVNMHGKIMYDLVAFELLLLSLFD